MRQLAHTASVVGDNDRKAWQCTKGKLSAHWFMKELNTSRCSATLKAAYHRQSVGGDQGDSTSSTGAVAVLGDTCDPSPPYQAQGAAMAVEDGATLGILLGKFSRAHPNQKATGTQISDLFGFYEILRKKRTTVNVEGSIENQVLYHMEDGPGEDARDKAFANVN
ncbi:uncharacterized protein ATNIH1004_009578 [Aspergillus tanneri]|nr:uncharacterized protein ATNIH1004_009578 [Aspergillus tanneri]KAA8642825.1 hypothetical protein ATNIH1004_009578 [Aspergillus tanneri]